MALTSITCTDNICLSNPRHPEGAFTPARSGSARRFSERFLRWSGVYTSACRFTLSKPHFAALGLWSINTDQSALPIPVGPAEKSLCERTLRVPASGYKQHHTISTNLSTAEPMHTMDMLWEKLQWILALYMKPISFQSKASVVCSVTAAVFIDFCLKRLNVFSQHIGKKQMNIWILQNKSIGIEMLINFLCQLLPKILLNDAASTLCEKS